MASTLSPRKQTTRGVGPIKSAGNEPGAISSVANEPDLVNKFLRDNPKGTLTDPPEEVEGGAVPFDDEGPPPERDPESIVPPETPADAPADAPATPPTETPASDAVAAPADAPAPQVAAAPPAPADAAPAPAEPKPAVEAAPSYDAAEKINLLPGSDPWTREQIVAGLQERATLQPRAAEADKFRTLFGFDYERAEHEWKPILDVLRNDPERTGVLDSVMRADPGLLQYLRESAAYYQTLPAEQRYAGSAPAAPANPATPAARVADPRMERYDRTFAAMQRQLAQSRAHNEWESAYQRYPFLRNDERARAALSGRASEMFMADEKAGKDPMECRGLLDAMNEQAVFLEAMGIAHANRTAPAPAAPPAAAPANPGATAMLGSGGAAPTPRVTSARPTGFRGDPDEAVAAFLRDHPGQ